MKKFAVSVSRGHTNHETINLESASTVVHVQTLLAHGSDHCGRNVSFLAMTKAPNFVALNASRLHADDVGKVIDRQASPAFTGRLSTVFGETPHTRDIDRMDEPSHNIERIWARLAKPSL